ncbi:MAG: DUF2975 domain-containing protein [Clostridia bacterium]
MTNKRTLHYVTKALIDFMFYSGILVCALVPISVYMLAPYSPVIGAMPLRLIAVLLVSGITSVYILSEIRRIFRTLLNTNPFTLENVKILRKIAVASFVISTTYIAKCIFWFTLGTAVIIIIFAIAGLFCLVLADVFKQAVLYKEENDLTV